MGSTPIDPSEAEGLIPHLVTQAELNEFEAQNIAIGVGWAESSRIIRRSFPSLETFRLLHKRMFDLTWTWAGSYRLTQKSVGIEAWRIQIETKNLLDDMHYWWLNKTYQPDEIAVRFHHRLTWIHAFPNGNGRHARVATDLLCRNHEIPLFTWGASSGPGVRTRYIEALRAADGADLAPLIAFVRT
jgi:Fic-DOC domain mobile mystery protein B